MTCWCTSLDVDPEGWASVDLTSWKATPVHRGVVQEQLGKKRGTTWVVKWDGFRKSAVHVGKDLSTVRLDPPDRPSDPPPKPPEADGAPPHPKRGAFKANDVAQAIWGTPKMMSPRTMAMMETEEGGATAAKGRTARLLHRRYPQITMPKGHY